MQLRPNQHPTDQFLLIVIEIFGCLHKQVDMFLHDCANVIWSLKRQKGIHFFVLLLLFIKKFQSHCKNTNIFHLKSSGSHRPSYFPTSAPSRHTSHLHGQPIASGWFLTWRNTTDLLQASILDAKRFWHLFWTNLMSCNFSLFLFLIPLYIFQIYSVFINKVLQGCIN
jgi:hypothetical protein